MSVFIHDGHVLLWCAKGHDHHMAPEQAVRLRNERCCWCRAPIVRIDVSHLGSYDHAYKEALSA